MLFEVGVDASDQIFGIDLDLEDADLVTEIACEIEANDRIEVVESFEQ
jgi:hypothetical protein